MTMKQRLGVLGAITVLTVPMAACTQAAAPQSTAVPTGPTTITWYAPPVAGSGDNDIRTVMIDAFQAKYPNIKVELASGVTNTDQNRAALTTQISGGSSDPDVYLGDNIWPAQFGKSGLAAPLSDYLPESFWDAFTPGLVEGVEYEGKKYSTPFMTDPGLLYYRKDLLEKHDLAVPTTWAELVQTSKTLMDAGEVKYGLVWTAAAYEGLTCLVNEFVTDTGGSILTEDGTAANIDSPESIAGVELLASFISEGISPAAVTTFQESQVQQAFVSGESAFLRNWPYAYLDANNPEASDIVGKVGVTTVPSIDGNGAGFSTAGGVNNFINPHTDELGASIAFVEFLSGVEAQTMIADRYQAIPVLAEVATDPQWTAANPVLAAAAEARIVVRPSYSPVYSEISEAIYSNVNAALSGSESIENALRTAADQIDAALEGGL